MKYFNVLSFPNRFKTGFSGFKLRAANFGMSSFVTKCHFFEKLFFPDFMSLLS